LITHNDAPHSVGLLWTNDQSVAETTTWQHTTLITQTSMPWVGFEPKISAGERPKTYALDRRATGTGVFVNYNFQKTIGASFQPVFSSTCLAFQTLANLFIYTQAPRYYTALQFLLTSQKTNYALIPFTASVLMWYHGSVQIIQLT